uniref:Rhotekin n=1 Tax=Catharus ustulatus TaxID=91951 RepID=A0A8C3U203_CATUS
MCGCSWDPIRAGLGPPNQCGDPSPCWHRLCMAGTPGGSVGRGSPMPGRFPNPTFPPKPQMWEEPELLQRALERALRVREGARRLLPACSRPEQALETTKTLVLCDARVVAAGGELQRRQEARLRGARRPSDAGPGVERVPCRGTVCISDLRIPLMWKDTEYFRNKGELHRCAVFLLLQVGAEIHDTPTVLVDRTLTDICFEGAVLFSEAGPDFELKVELYSAGLPGAGAQGSTPKKLATRLSTSLGRSSGRRARAAMEGGPGSPPGTGGTGLLAHAALSLAQVHDGFRTHDLVIAADEQSPCWVPLYGRMCCRLAARPSCMDTPAATGTLRLQGDTAGLEVVRGFWGALGSLGSLGRWAQGVPVPQDTRVRAVEPGGRGQPPGVAVTNRLGGEEVTHALLAESAAEAQRWLQAFGQHLYDLGEPGLLGSLTPTWGNPDYPCGTLHIPVGIQIIPVGPCTSLWESQLSLCDPAHHCGNPNYLYGTLHIPVGNPIILVGIQIIPVGPCTPLQDPAHPCGILHIPVGPPSPVGPPHPCGTPTLTGSPSPQDPQPSRTPILRPPHSRDTPIQWDTHPSRSTWVLGGCVPCPPHCPCPHSPVEAVL